jgi:hypothetical protein
MTIPTYPVYCYQVDSETKVACRELATFKIAARWSDGQTDELKTYYLSCEKCLSRLYQLALAKQVTCPLAQGETLDKPTIFERPKTPGESHLNPRPDLEEQFGQYDSKS